MRRGHANLLCIVPILTNATRVSTWARERECIQLFMYLPLSTVSHGRMGLPRRLLITLLQLLSGASSPLASLVVTLCSPTLQWLLNKSKASSSAIKSGGPSSLPKRYSLSSALHAIACPTLADLASRCRCPTPSTASCETRAPSAAARASTTSTRPRACIAARYVC